MISDHHSFSFVNNSQGAHQLFKDFRGHLLTHEYKNCICILYRVLELVLIYTRGVKQASVYFTDFNCNLQKLHTYISHNNTGKERLLLICTSQGIIDFPLFPMCEFSPIACSGEVPSKGFSSSFNCSGSPPDLMLNCRLPFFSTHSWGSRNCICYSREENQLAFIVTGRPINLPKRKIKNKNKNKNKSEWVVRAISVNSLF
jgi:hypothetical protein